MSTFEKPVFHDTTGYIEDLLSQSAERIGTPSPSELDIHHAVTNHIPVTYYNKQKFPGLQLIVGMDRGAVKRLNDLREKQGESAFRSARVFEAVYKKTGKTAVAGVFNFDDEVTAIESFPSPDMTLRGESFHSLLLKPGVRKFVRASPKTHNTLITTTNHTWQGRFSNADHLVHLIHGINRTRQSPD